jgi:hypothetical protein
MPKNYNTQNAHLGDSSIMVGAIESYSADTPGLFSTLPQHDLAETAAHEETTSNFFGLSLILIIASVAILLVRRLRRVKTRRAGRSYL